ncbi:tetratricopeptide repeat protein [Pseudomonas sp. B22129]|uniref:tetratricopeptide repeat protein n=1 Tax=Pseudomonas sp. B22129 TaxID=3235111 RepID=UPI003783CEC1
MPEPERHKVAPRRYLYPVLIALLLSAMAGLWVFLQTSTPQLRVPAPVVTTKPAAVIAPASMVDEQQCQGCHQAQARDWQGSHHQLAMQRATPQTVPADFNDATFTGEGETTRFFRRGDEFWVNAPGVDGQNADFKVAYTFGIAPLQQYLVEVGDGRLQALGVAWDTQKNRWFHLYPGQGVNFKNPLHWSKPSQNANFMCVECHTTGYTRNFNPEKSSFDSQWNSLGVGCQACHGPASNHVQWAAKKGDLLHAGFAVDLKDKNATVELETCARCHARRAPLGDGFTVGKRLMDDYLPSVLTRELYTLDGKIKDEVFEHGSFAQSKMAEKGVRCSNCHNPHSAGLKAPGNAVCVQCHNPAGKTPIATVDGRGLQAKDYNSRKHTKLDVGQPGSFCVDCHMPGKVYMGNDFRHDHSFSIPPAAQSVLRAPTYGDSMALIRNGEPGAAQALYDQLARGNLPAIQRATLLVELPNYPSEQALKLATKDLAHPAPQVRESAVRAVSALLPPAERLALYGPLLKDPVRAVRIVAARDLLGAQGLGPAWESAIADYEQVQLSLLERAEANLNLAMLYQASGRGDKVEAQLRTALLRDPDFYPALVTLAQWLEANGRAAQARNLITEQLARQPDAPLLQHTQGLMLIRAGDVAGAMPHLRNAARLDPANGQFSFVLAVALHDSGKVDEACNQLESLLQRQPYHRNARLTLIQYYLENGHEPKAQAVMQSWKRLNPGDPALK